MLAFVKNNDTLGEIQ